MNKKLIALLVAILTVSTSMFAHYKDCWTDSDGVRHCEKRGHLFSRDRECIDGDCYYDEDRPVRGTVRRTVEGTGEAARDVVRVGTLGLVD